jgi:hypothetical protein
MSTSARKQHNLAECGLGTDNSFNKDCTQIISVVALASDLYSALNSLKSQKKLCCNSKQTTLINLKNDSTCESTPLCAVQQSPQGT